MRNQSIYWNKEWKNRIFIFLGGLNDDYENIRNQTLNMGEFSSIEEVYSKVESEEQRKSVIIESKNVDTCGSCK